MAEDNVKQATAVYKAFCEMLDEMEWNYDSIDEKLVIVCTTKGDDLPIKVQITVDPTRCLVILMSPMPFTVPEEVRKELAVAVSAANYNMVDGNFDYNYLDGSISFRMTAGFKDSLISQSVLLYMLMIACRTIDDYNDKFLMVAKKKMTIAEILDFIK